MGKERIALLYDKSYIDTQYCYMELASQLADSGFHVDLYMPFGSNNHVPFFENQAIRVLPFPDSVFHSAEYWLKILYARDRKYRAVIGTPIRGAWAAYRTATFQKIPYYYFADELLEHLLTGFEASARKKLTHRNYISNKKAIASITLGEGRYRAQKEQNKIDYPHNYIVIPNAQAGPAVKLKSNYFRDIFNIEDRKPILLFAGTLNWSLAKRIYEESKSFGERNYHLIFHARTLGLMGQNNHPFIKVSTMPIPATMLNYAFSSADMGLAIYDKNSEHESNNGITGGKIGTYLKNGLPLIAGSAENLKVFEDEKVGIYWDGELPFDQIASKAINEMEANKKAIPEFYRKNLQYEFFFEKFRDHLLQAIA
jgi:hypothetical protein